MRPWNVVFKKWGLKPIKLSERPQAASGVGGEAKPLFSSLVPIVLGKQPGVIKLTVLDQDIPQLLSIGLLEFTGSIVDINSNTITFCKFGSQSPMNRLHTGHRSIDISSGEGGQFPVPEALAVQFGLAPGAFNSSLSEACEDYMAAVELSRRSNSIFFIFAEVF